MKTNETKQTNQKKSLKRFIKSKKKIIIN